MQRSWWISLRPDFEHNAGLEVIFPDEEKEDDDDDDNGERPTGREAAAPGQGDRQRHLVFREQRS